MAKPKPPELPKDAYGDDFPTLSVRETANRWGGGLAKRAGGVPPKEGGPGSLQSSPGSGQNGTHGHCAEGRKCASAQSGRR